MIAKVSKLSTPWLLPIAGQATMSISHIPTHIKHIKTTAPVDLKAAKRERTHDKQEAKQRKENARKPTIAKVSATKETSTTNP
jgi:ribonuclease P/MRP protein subunit POP3